LWCQHSKGLRGLRRMVHCLVLTLFDSYSPAQAVLRQLRLDAPTTLSVTPAHCCARVAPRNPRAWQCDEQLPTLLLCILFVCLFICNSLTGQSVRRFQNGQSEPECAAILEGVHLALRPRDAGSRAPFVWVVVGRVRRVARRSAGREEAPCPSTAPTQGA
jgi:hypothetical protein